MDFLRKGKAGQIHIPLFHINEITRFLNRSSCFWHRQFTVKFCSEVSDVVRDVLSYINEEAEDGNKGKQVIGTLQDEKFESSHLDNLVNYYVDPIWRKYYVTEMVQRILGEYRIYIGNALLRQKNLMKRITGLKYINETLRQVRSGYNIKLLT
jgi:hypothetical protein